MKNWAIKHRWEITVIVFGVLFIHLYMNSMNIGGLRGTMWKLYDNHLERIEKLVSKSEIEIIKSTLVETNSEIEVLKEEISQLADDYNRHYHEGGKILKREKSEKSSGESSGESSESSVDTRHPSTIKDGKMR